MRHFRGRIVLLGAVLFILIVPGKGWSIAGQGVGVRVGYVFGYNNQNLEGKGGKRGIEPEGLWMIGGHLTCLSIGRFGADLSGEYAWRDFHQRVGVGGIEVPYHVIYPTFKIRDLAYFLSGRYNVTWGTSGLYLGGGINLHFTTCEAKGYPWSALDPADIIPPPDGDIYFGFHALVGGSLALTAIPAHLFSELRVVKTGGSSKVIQQGTVLAGITFGAF